MYLINVDDIIRNIYILNYTKYLPNKYNNRWDYNIKVMKKNKINKQLLKNIIYSYLKILF
jgi:hypothetical protein